VGFFNEMKNRARFNRIERKKNRIITRQNIAMKIHSLPGEIRSWFDHWRYNFVNDIREIKNFKGTLRLGIWLSMIAIVVVWAFFYGKIQTVLDSIIKYSAIGDERWLSLTRELAAKLPFISGLDTTLQSLATPFLGNTVIGWLAGIAGFVGKFIIWCVPALLLVKHYSKTKGIRSFGRMFRRPFSLRYCWGSLVVILAWIAISAGTEFFERGQFYLDPGFQPLQLITTVLSVTICEEILLRGWLLNALNTRGGPIYSSIMVSGFYFLLLLPKWIPTGIFSHTGPLIMSLAITFVFTFSLCIAFNRSRSIWTSIGLRAIWALCNILLPGTF